MTDKSYSKPKIEIQDLRKAYINPGDGVILEVFGSFSLSIYPGEVISILGPSGCGKTTFLKMIAGLIVPTAGCINFEGRKTNDNASKSTMVFQDLHLFNWMTVYQNIAFSYQVRRVEEETAKSGIAELLDLFGLRSFSKYYPHEISGGMRQRLALARALAADPSVLLLDEPFNSLDVGTKTELEVEFFRLIKEKKITTILVSHDVRQAVYLGDRIVVLSKRPGKIRTVLDVPFSGDRNRNLWESQEFHQLEVSLSKMLKENI